MTSKLNSKEILALQMRYLGKSSREIAVATGYDEGHIRNLFAKGGRLESQYQDYQSQRNAEAQEVAKKVLEAAKTEAEACIQRMIDLSKDPSNGPVCFKANEYLLQLAGAATQTTLLSILRGMSYESALERVNEVFKELFGKPIETNFQINITTLSGETKQL